MAKSRLHWRRNEKGDLNDPVRRRFDRTAYCDNPKFLILADLLSRNLRWGASTPAVKTTRSTTPIKGTATAALKR